MKTIDEFWNIIQTYNQDTLYIQVILSLLLIGMLILSFFKRNQVIEIIIKNLFGAIFIFIGIYFFMIIDQSFTAIFFGFYFIGIGILFLLSLPDSKLHLQYPTPTQYMLYFLVLLYPMISYFLNHKYPRQVLYILPCPISAMALITYCRFSKRNDILNVMLIIWGLTGIKAFIFDVKEDLILLIVGLYGLYNFLNYKGLLESMNKRRKESNE